MFGNEGWRWVGSPQPPTPGKVVALGDRAAGAGPLSAEWGRGGQGPEARAPRLRSGPGSPAAVSSAWIPDPPFLRPGRCLRPARPAQPPSLAAARVQPPPGRVITVSPPDQTAAGHRCRAVALSPDGLAGSSSFVSGGRHHGPRAVGTGSRLPQPQPARPARATRGPSFRRRPAWTPCRWALTPCAPSLQHPPRPASNAYSFSNTHLRRVLLQEAHLDSPPPSLGALCPGGKSWHRYSLAV